MRREAQAAAGFGRAMKADGVTGPTTRPPLNGRGRGMVELSLLVPGGEATALETAAEERGLTAAQLARILINEFLGRTSDPRTPAAVIRTRYGRRLFETKEEFIDFQRGCFHRPARWVHGRRHDYLVCDRCWTVLEVGQPDHHPDISRWLSEGGAGAR